MTCEVEKENRKLKRRIKKLEKENKELQDYARKNLVEIKNEE
jgi:cell division protein FtsB